MIIENDKPHVEHLGRDIWWVSIISPDFEEPKDILMELGSLKMLAGQIGTLRSTNTFETPVTFRANYYEPGDSENPHGIMRVNYELNLSSLTMKPEFLEELARTHVDIPIDLANI